MANNKSIEKRINNAVVASSSTKGAQLKALWHESNELLQTKNADGSITTYSVTKRQQCSKYGLEPKMSGKACLGYTPAMFNAATADDLKLVGADGKVIENYVYLDRVIRLQLSEDPTEKEVPVYTEAEADKKVKGESAQSIKVYRKFRIDPCGWSPKLLMKVLEQSYSIADEIEKARKSREKWNELKKGPLYIVENRNGKLVKIEVKVNDDISIDNK